MASSIPARSKPTRNRAELLPINVRTALHSALNGRELDIDMARRDWQFIGIAAIRKADGFTVTLEELGETEVWT